MINPYDSPQAPASPGVTLAANKSGRPRFWRSLFIAYGVHHGFSLLGFLAGMICTPSRWESYVQASWANLLFLVMVPLFDLFMLLEPLGVGDFLPPGYMALRCMRSVGVVTLAVAGIAYAITRRRGALWYLAIASFVLSTSLVIQMAIDASHE